MFRIRRNIEDIIHTSWLDVPHHLIINSILCDDDYFWMGEKLKNHIVNVPFYLFNKTPATKLKIDLLYAICFSSTVHFLFPPTHKLYNRRCLKRFYLLPNVALQYTFLPHGTQRIEITSYRSYTMAPNQWKFRSFDIHAFDIINVFLHIWDLLLEKVSFKKFAHFSRVWIKFKEILLSRTNYISFYTLLSTTLKQTIFQIEYPTITSTS